MSSHGSMKKRAAPPPPTQNNNNPATPCHSRTPSDPGLSQSPSGAIHRRNHSTDLISCSSHSINNSGSSTPDFSINGNNLRFQTTSVTTVGRTVISFWMLHFWMDFFCNNPLINKLRYLLYFYPVLFYFLSFMWKNIWNTGKLVHFNTVLLTLMVL